MIKFDITNRFTGAAQFTAEIDCDDSELTSTKIGLAVKWGIKTRADLAGADLAGAKIIRKVAQIRRDDGYEFIAFALDDGRLFVCAGCRSMTVEAFRAHVAKEYPETDKAIETLAILDFIDARHAATSTVLENVA